MKEPSSFFVDNDTIGTRPQFYIENNGAHKSKIGGIISLFFIKLGILLYFIYVICEVFVIKRAKINSEEEVVTFLPIYNISANDDLQFFFMFTNTSLNFQNLDYSKVIINLITIKTYFENNQWKKVIDKKINIIQCPKDILEKAKFSMFLQTNKIHENFIYCPEFKENEIIQIGGDFLHGDKLYKTSIQISPNCLIESSCTDDEKKIFIDYTSKTNLLFVNSYNNPEPFDYNNPVKKVFKQNSFDLNSSSVNINLEYSINKMKLYDSVLPFVEANEKSMITYSNMYFSENKNLQISINILVNHKVKFYVRYYTTVDLIIGKVFSIYLSFNYFGTLLLGFLHTFNMERFLINSTLINENCVSKKKINLSANKINSRNSQNDDFSMNVSPKSTEKILNKVDYELSEDIGKSVNMNSIISVKDLGYNNLSNLENLKKLNEIVNNAKIKMNLKNRYFCFSKKSKNFIVYFDAVKSILDVRNYIKMFLQFEKLKKVLFDRNEKLAFEIFNDDIAFLDDNLYNKNLEEMTDDELNIVLSSVEEIKADVGNKYGKKIYNLVNQDLKKIL